MRSCPVLAGRHLGVWLLREQTRNNRKEKAMKELKRWRKRLAAEDGMATAEYAVVTLAAAAFGGLLLALARSGELRDALLGILRSALSVG